MLSFCFSFRRTREDLMTGMYKILDRVKAHKDAWPFLDPVNEDYAPKYYSVIAKPMDLQTMEDKLDNGEYGSLQQFKADFQLIVDNCRQYNGSDNGMFIIIVITLKSIKTAFWLRTYLTPLKITSFYPLSHPPLLSLLFP